MSSPKSPLSPGAASFDSGSSEEDDDSSQLQLPLYIPTTNHTLAAYTLIPAVHHHPSAKRPAPARARAPRLTPPLRPAPPPLDPLLQPSCAPPPALLVLPSFETEVDVQAYLGTPILPALDNPAVAVDSLDLQADGLDGDQLDDSQPSASSHPVPLAA